MRTIVLTALFLLFLPLVASAEPPVALGYALEVGDRYEVEKTNSSKTVTLTQVEGETQQETESQTSVIVHGLEVREIGEDGSLGLRFTTKSGVIEKSGGTSGYKLTMRRSDSGVKHVEVDLSSAGPEASAMRTVLEVLGSDLLDLKVDFVLTKQGEVVSSKIEGALFENIPTDTPVLEMVGKILKEILPRDELAGAATADGFPVVPEDGVSLGSTWPVKRTIAIMGLSLDGAGRCKLLSVDGGTARIEERQTYQVDASGLARRMERMTMMLYGQMGLEFAVKVDLEPPQPLEVRAVSTFDLEDGFVRTTEWETMKVGLRGIMEISVMGETTEATLAVDSEADVKLTWKKE